MILDIERTRRLHHFLVRHSFYPMLFASLLAGVLLAARLVRNDSEAFAGLAWNLFLAWIPYLAALGAALLRAHLPSRRAWLLLLPGAVWLAFFPNAPYIITDFSHLGHSLSVPLWYDIGLLALFALTGLFMGVLSLRIMQRLVEGSLGVFWGWAFVLVALAFGGVGIYLGRFVRLNSWDLILHPGRVLRDVLLPLFHPGYQLQILGVSFLFAAVLLVCYLVLVSRECA